MEASVLVIGIGNDYRGDDGIGLAVVRALRASQPENVQLMECDGDCTVLLEAWKDTSKVILIDAAVSGASVGTISRFDAHTQVIPVNCTFSSTHAFGIAETLMLAHILDQLPPYLIVYGIEGENFTCGEKLSPSVRKAIPTIVEQVLVDISIATTRNNL